jgi:hypothetical protein
MSKLRHPYLGFEAAHSQYRPKRSLAGFLIFNRCPISIKINALYISYTAFSTEMWITPYDWSITSCSCDAAELTLCVAVF